MQAAAPAKRRLTAFARKHSVLTTAAATQPSREPGAAPAASLVAEVQEVVASTLGVKAAPTLPLMEAGMDSLGELSAACQ